jgi:hypothetical protein
MNIPELCRITGIAGRQIRYLIAEEFNPAPQGGRANADYGANHGAGCARRRVAEVKFKPRGGSARFTLQGKKNPLGDLIDRLLIGDPA